MSASQSATPDPASPTRYAKRSSIHSSPPARQDPGPGSASPPSKASCNNTAASSASRASRDAAVPSESSFRLPPLQPSPSTSHFSQASRPPPRLRQPPRPPPPPPPAPLPLAPAG